MEKEEIDKIIYSFKELYQDKKSLDKITMNDIVSSSGVSMGKIYSLFESKEDIALHLISKRIEDIFITFDEEVDNTMTLAEKLKTFISLQLEFISDIYPLVKDMTLDIVNPFSKVHDYYSHLRKKYFNFMKDLIIENKKTFFKDILISTLINSFIIFNITIFSFWEKDNSPGKEETLKYIDKGVKNFIVMITLI
ncbi:MAG: hypothetical protein KatS3mg068_0875 [Candidatus Sericytochromatia bacterium]|nr:MAG: hypothetical protein KatS3mg068_0875 [Candidatus Sericytochromatia bacterium]